MKTTLIKIYTSDNLELAGLLYEPDDASVASSSTKKVLLHVHGMAGNFYENAFLDPIARTLTESGVAYMTFNNRGCELIKDMYKVTTGAAGDTRTIVRMGDTFERFTDCIIDIKAAIDFLASKGFTEIHVDGHSLAGPKVAYYAAQTKDPRITSLIFLSPADMIGLAKVDKDYDADMKMAREMIGQGKGREIMPKVIWGDCYLSAQTFMDLADENSPANNFNLYDVNSTLRALAAISVPTLTLMGKKDSALTVPVETLMERLKNALTVSASKQIIVGDADHQFNGYQQQVADMIKEWVTGGFAK